LLKKNYKVYARKHNCGFIDPELWVSPGFVLDGYREDGIISFECPASAFKVNHFAIKHLLMISKSSYNAFEMTYLENAAMLDFLTAKEISSTIRTERESP